MAEPAFFPPLPDAFRRFKDEATFHAHFSTEALKSSVKVLLEEDLLEKPFRTITLEPVGGFPERIQTGGDSQ